MAACNLRGMPRTTLENYRMRSTLLALTGALVLALPFASAADGQAARPVGYVNMNVLLSEMAQASGVPEAMQAEEARLQGELDRLSGALNRLMESYQQQAPRLDDEARQRRAAEIQSRQRELQERAVDADRELAVKEDELLTPIVRDIMAAVEAVRVEGGYAFIFDGSSGAFLAADPELDLTEAVRRHIERSASGEDL